ncbi:MAG: phenylacetate--CoA ligase family protein [Phycisphaerae bacterium]
MNPRVVRHILLPLHERLLRRPTRAVERGLEQSQWWPAERLATLQVAKLRRLLSTAAANIPLWRQRFADAGIDPAGATLDELTRLPLLDKSQLRAGGAAFTWPGVPGGLFPATTGGSSGEPLRFWTDRARQAADQAARTRSRRWYGIEPGERELYLWGSPVERTRQDRLHEWRDWLVNHRLLDAFRMTPERMRAGLAELERFNPRHLFGYPSTLAMLVRFARDGGRVPRVPALRAVFVTGETLQPADRDILFDTFRVPVSNGYGAREAGFIAHECPAGRLHITAESVIVELLPVAGGAGDLAEVVVTHLDGLGMPLIRYRTGDLARRDSRPCPCGRALPVLAEVAGRCTDLLRRADGGAAHALSLIYVLRDEPAVGRFRIVQRRGLDLDVSIVPAGALEPADRARISARLAGQLGGVGVTLRLVDDLPSDASGKFRYVASEAN